MTNAIIALQLMLAKGVGPRSISNCLRGLQDAGFEISEPPDMHMLVQHGGLAADTAVQVVSSRTQAIALYHEMQDAGVTITTVLDPAYPSRLRQVLGSRCPPILFIRGDRQVLQSPGIGFCGSRGASEANLKCASQMASDLARLGFNVVSGYAQGVDEAAHLAAIQSGSTTLVLAEGIAAFRPRASIREFLDCPGLVAVSQFPPHMKWSPSAAMQRNETICGLSRSLVVVESRTEGGTFEAGKSAMKLGLPLLVLASEPPAPGNAFFLSRGAIPIAISQGRVDVTLIARYSERETQQGDLFRNVG